MQKIIKNIAKIAFLAAFVVPFNGAHAASPISCPLTASNNSYIVNFPATVIVSDIGTAFANEVSVNANIPAGSYNITAVTWDDHAGHGGLNQTKEQLFFHMYTSGNSSLGATLATADIGETDQSATSVVATNMSFGSAIGKIVAKHSWLGTPKYQSVYPICIKFEDVTPAVNLNISCSVSDTSINVGESVNYTANIVSAGTAPYTYTWSGSVSNTTKTFSKQYNSTGSFSASVTVRDAAGNTDTANCQTVVVGSIVDTDFSVSCAVSDRNVDEDDDVTFTANVTGGTTPFTYRWSGDASGSGRSITESFDNEGDYHVNVRVTDDAGRIRSADCATVVVGEEENDDLEVSCEVSDSSIEEGDEVRISVDIDGGNGPFDIEWDGDIDDVDDFDDNAKSQRVEFEDSGRYEFEVTVEDDNGDEDSDTCVVRVSDDRSSLATTDGNLAGLSSVYLSQVPYTGVEDTAKVFGFIALIAVWSAAIAYYLLKNKTRTVVKSKIQAFKEANLAKKQVRG